MHRFLLSAFPLLLHAGCAGADGAGDTFAVRDSAGVQIVESTTPDPAVPPMIDAEPILDIGEAEGRPEYLLARVIAAARRSDGSIAVADGGANVVRVYDADGVHLFSFGGPGDGPGEFRAISGLHVMPGDTLMVFDGRHGRVTFVAPDGALVREVTFAPRQRIASVEPASDGSLLAMLPPVPRPDDPQEGRPIAAVVRFDGAGTLLDTLLQVPGMRMERLVLGGRGVVVPSPWGGNSYVAVLGDEVLIGTAESCTLERMRTDGTQVASVRWPCELELTERHIAEWKDRMLEAGGEDPEAVELFRRITENVPFPATRGAYGRFLVASDGTVWVPELTISGPEPERWTVLGADGRLLGSPALPEGFTPLEIGDDYVLGRWRDELDVQHVRLYERSGG